MAVSAQPVFNSAPTLESSSKMAETDFSPQSAPMVIGLVVHNLLRFRDINEYDLSLGHAGVLVDGAPKVTHFSSIGLS